MGRIAGVTAAETRDRLLNAAADVFAERGYDGTRVADIATAAGVSNAALYAHFGSKAELLVEALRARGPRLLGDALRADPDQPITEALLLVGRRLPRRRDAGGHLVVEALVAARRHPSVAKLMRAHLDERSGWLADLVRASQLTEDVDPSVSADAVAHFCLLLAMGSALVPAELHGVDPDGWNRLLRRVVGALAAPDGSNGGDQE
jgi:AcrR family transcriptional regulator